jgi:hypothetical protein
MNKEKYYIRVAISDCDAFEAHLKTYDTECTQLSRDFSSTSTAMYAVDMDSEMALSLKLSFPVKGFMNFNKTMGKLVSSTLT